MKYMAKVICVGLLATVPLNLSAWGTETENTQQQKLISLAKWILAVQAGSLAYQGVNQWLHDFSDTLELTYFPQVEKELLKDSSGASKWEKLSKGIKFFEEKKEKKELIADLQDWAGDLKLKYSHLASLGTGTIVCLLTRLLLNLDEWL